ncbi:alpha/beta hydrolase [Halorarum halophilum]|uniref:Alpha/beta hydrolase n=1 Tax=Halorarum halophilum TaxID=2743090 RepID=A0A7D5GB68_9EURY|nr:alpha/beta hydrolase [Halobaculum halophilum]QLG27246.1 alpha/beta hydrolase [Halobaculum halophilum]
MSDPSSFDGYSRRGFLSGIGAAGTAGTLLGRTAAASRGESPAPTRDVDVHEGLTYAERDGESLELDLYVPETDDPSPLVVWIHGGAWVAGDRTRSPDLRRYFASRGYAMATIEYRLSAVPRGVTPTITPNGNEPRGTFPDQIVDVKAAIRWLRSEDGTYDLDPDNVAVWGRSAGGHLAALAGTAADVEEIAGDVYPDEAVEKTVAPAESGRVQAVVDWCGLTDFLEADSQLDGRGFSHSGPGSPESLLLGGRITENEDEVERANPITYVDSEDPPFLIVHGRADTTVPYQQSELLYEALRDACVDATYYELDGLGHRFGFDELSRTPGADQTVLETRDCEDDEESTPGDGSGSSPPIGPDAIEQFLDRNLGQ